MTSIFTIIQLVEDRDSGLRCMLTTHRVLGLQQRAEYDCWEITRL